MNVAKIITSLIFKNVLSRSFGILGRPRKILTVVQNVMAHANKAGARSEIADLMTMTRMMKAFALNQYRGLPWRSGALILAGLMYFALPIDILPDFLPFGFADDFALLVYIYRKSKKDIEDFRAWELSQVQQAS